MAKRLQPDWTLFLTVTVMVAFGLVIVFSASSVVAEVKFREETHHFVLRQAGAALLGIAALIFLRGRDYKILRSPAWAFASLGSVLILLVAVYFADPNLHRWIKLGPLNLQPSELAKPALILFLAYFITTRSHSINNRHTLLAASLALAVLAGCVVIADLGTAIVLVITAAAIFWAAGIERRYLVAAGVIGMLLVAGAIVSKPYRFARFLQYVDPEYKILDRIDPKGAIKSYAHSSSAPRDTTYQPKQARIAVGSGGVFGVGLGEGTQKLLFLPEAHTDFIYAVVGEELGLWGCLGLLAGFMIIFSRGLRLFWAAPDDFGRYLALGITVSIVAQALINMTVVLDLAPTKGIPLPMISYGGSSMLSTLTSLGLLLSVSERAS